jgi:hypothetical protein
VPPAQSQTHTAKLEFKRISVQTKRCARRFVESGMLSRPMLSIAQSNTTSSFRTTLTVSKAARPAVVRLTRPLNNPHHLRRHSRMRPSPNSQLDLQPHPQLRLQLRLQLRHQLPHQQNSPLHLLRDPRLNSPLQPLRDPRLRRLPNSQLEFLRYRRLKSQQSIQLDLLQLPRLRRRQNRQLHLQRPHQLHRLPNNQLDHQRRRRLRRLPISQQDLLRHPQLHRLQNNPLRR